MVAGSYNINTPGWQIRKTVRQFQEWFEYQFSKVDLEGPDLPQWSWPAGLARGLFWVLVVGLGLWLSWLLYRAILASWQKRQARQAAQPATRSVPTPEVRSAQAWWREANALAQAGQYRAACRALYLAALQKLHEQQQIVYDPSRTDGEYLQTLAQAPRGRPYELLIRTHERSEFGNATVSAETYQRCRQAYQEIDRP
ncbi:DUF4129 domain-containing protein [Pseudanabaena sp. FACHB-2040]|uniref:DUF4129 domain-containing protein n=1 Tax=Pseudanabaena sp. FACHB-2040 TaxID=2692859 RepID=UPI0016897E21|nr:DUF4129 domain-containing protein [Pseudanabaena sp. FACHB-2040]MBD2260360.1 DUF4129 domain-containing protein [Pseudanabaena sp. FACHB-2040]